MIMKDVSLKLKATVYVSYDMSEECNDVWK